MSFLRGLLHHCIAAEYVYVPIVFDAVQDPELTHRIEKHLRDGPAVRHMLNQVNEKVQDAFKTRK